MEAFSEPSLVVLVGPIGAGKSTWAKSRFRANEVVALSDLKAAVGRDRFDREATRVADELLDRIVDVRLGRGLTAVVDTEGLDDGKRTRWLALARSHSIPAVAVLFMTDLETCLARNEAGSHPFPPSIIKRQVARCREIESPLGSEGFSIRKVSGTEGDIPAR